MIYKAVKSGGLEWTVMSRNERAITHEGRHFLAARCNPSRAWTIIEMDRSLVEHGTAKEVKRFLILFDTRWLSDGIRDILKKGGASL